MSDSVHMKETRSFCRFPGSYSTLHTHTWTIEDFEERLHEDSKKDLNCLIFIDDRVEKNRLWWITLEPDSVLNSKDHKIKIRSSNIASAKIRKVKTAVSVVDSSGRRHKIGEDFLRKENSRHDDEERVYMKIKFNLKDDDLIVVNDTLVIVCEITLFSDFEEEYREEKDGQILNNDPSSSKTKLVADLAQNRDEFTDINIIVQGKTFPCHRFMLSARSRVFQAMLQTNMRERESGKIKIQDLTSEVVSEMLEFIYTGEIKKNLSGDLLRELLIAADKYQLDLMKNMCEELLSSAVSVENCLKNLSIANLCGAINLKKASIQFILNNSVTVTTSKEWLNCIKNHPELAAEVTQSIAKNRFTPEAKRRRTE